MKKNVFEVKAPLCDEDGLMLMEGERLIMIDENQFQIVKGRCEGMEITLIPIEQGNCLRFTGLFWDGKIIHG